MKSALNWFEIPVTNLDRATKFYETMLQAKLRRENFHGTEMAVIVAEDAGVGGALILDKKRKPNGDGTLVYLNANGQLDAAIRLASESGGSVVLPKTEIGDIGAIALIRDTEGNQIGLHSDPVR
jgi:predicted enzyme related to lactoylglutathione lyase